MERTKKFYIEIYMMLNDMELNAYRDYNNPASTHFKSEWMQGFLGCIDMVQIKLEKKLEEYMEGGRNEEA